MSWIAQIFCFPSVAYRNVYSSLSKRDDDFGLEQVSEWIGHYPVPNKVDFRSVYATDQYAKKTIKDLGNKVPLTETTLVLVKEHLVNTARVSDTLRKKLIDRFSAKFGESEEFQPVVLALICALPVRKIF